MLSANTLEIGNLKGKKKKRKNNWDVKTICYEDYISYSLQY